MDELRGGPQGPMAPRRGQDLHMSPGPNATSRRAIAEGEGAARHK